MESYLSEHAEILVPGLAFDLGKRASMLQERSEATFYPSGPTDYIPNQGGRVIKFTISSAAQWAMLQTCRLQLDIENTRTVDQDAGGMRFLGSLPNVLISELKVNVAGVSAEVLPDYNRWFSTFEQCLPASSRAMNSSAEAGLLQPYGATPQGTAAQQDSQASKISAAHLCGRYAKIGASDWSDPGTADVQGSKPGKLTVSGPLLSGFFRVRTCFLYTTRPSKF